MRASVSRQRCVPPRAAPPRILASDLDWITGRHTSVEVRRSLARELVGPDLAAARRQFEHDWANTAVVELTPEVCQAAAELAEVTGARSLDALHLGDLTHDVIRQPEGAVAYPIPVLVFALWLYGTLVLSDRLGAYIIMLFGGLFGAAMIIVHADGIVVGKSGGFFFVWTLFALSTTGWVTMILSARGISTAFRSRRAARRAATSGMSAADH